MRYSGWLKQNVEHVELTLQWLSRSDTGRHIDGRVGTVEGYPPLGRPLLTYQRYNLRFDDHPRRFRDAVPARLPDGVAETIAGQVARDYPRAVLDRLSRMDRPHNMKELKKLGTPAATVVRPEPFPAAFDRWPISSR